MFGQIVISGDREGCQPTEYAKLKWAEHTQDSKCYLLMFMSLNESDPEPEQSH